MFPSDATPFITLVPLVCDASMSNPSWSGSRLRQKLRKKQNKNETTFHIPERTSTIQQLQTLTKFNIVRQEGPTNTPTTWCARSEPCRWGLSKTHISSWNHTTNYNLKKKKKDLTVIFLYTTTLSAEVVGRLRIYRVTHRALWLVKNNSYYIQMQEFCY